jgi:Integrase core domain
MLRILKENHIKYSKEDLIHLKKEIKTCEVCQMCKPDLRGEKGLFEAIDPPEMVGNFLTSDVMGPINVNNKSYSVIVSIDRLSRFLWVKPMESSPKSEDLIELIQKGIAETKNIPKRFLSDNGRIYTSNRVNDFF